MVYSPLRKKCLPHRSKYRIDSDRPRRCVAIAYHQPQSFISLRIGGDALEGRLGEARETAQKAEARKRAINQGERGPVSGEAGPVRPGE